MRRLFLGALLCLALFGLSGCTHTESAALPDLNLLEPIPYAGEDEPQAARQAGESALRVDLWLDASQTMGGINLNDESMYPRMSRKYREGGFHYRYQGETGQYEALLRCLLASAEGSRVRLLRLGTERITDAFLAAQRLSRDGDAETLRSLRRDMLTYAIDPMPTIFSDFSSESMKDSFYALGSPLLNQLDNLPADGLENANLADEMAQALDELIEAVADGDAALTAQAQDDDWPLLHALENIDLSRLSAIVFDPAGMRRLSVVEADGTPVDLITQALRNRGVFDRGLTVGLYAFTLDYMGQISSFGAADFSEPLLWGKLNYNSYRETVEGVLPMPRTLLALLVGTPEQVEAYTSALHAQIAASDALAEMRGPDKGQLTYTADGQTVTQQPFSFTWDRLEISRPEQKLRTQAAGDVTLSGAEDGKAPPTVTVSPDEAFETVLSLPLDSQGVAADLSAIAEAAVTVEDALLLSGILPSAAETAVSEGAQVLALRDKRYVFEHQTLLENPFRMEAAAQDGRLNLRITAAPGLTPGYYRLQVSVDYASGSAEWVTPAWVSQRNAVLTNADIAEWEAFTQQMARYERKREYISRPFQHAWGPATDSTYHGLAYPDFPPVWQAPGLSELVRQIQAAADVERAPCLRYTFDVFVKP